MAAAAATTTSIRDLFVQQFRDTPLEKLVGPSREILALEPAETIFEVINKLKEKDIRSAPVHMDSSTIVFVDFIDIVAYVIDTLEKCCINSSSSSSGGGGGGGGGSDEVNSSDKNNRYIKGSFIQNVSLQQQILHTPISKVVNYSKLDKFSTLPLHASALDASLELSKGNKRVMVLEDENSTRFTNIVTHSDIINLMKQTIDDKGNSNFASSIESLGIGVPLTDEIIVSENKRAIDAFALMRHHNDSFVPVVGEDRQLISVISARDIQVLTMGENGFKLLTLPVLDFLSTVRQLSPVDKYPFIFCFPHSSIDLVVKRLKATRVNRLIIINEEKHPIGVVSVSHLAKYIVGKTADTID